MDKRQFLKTSGTLVAGSMLSGFAFGEQKSVPRTNWSGNYQYRAERLDLPKSAEQVQQIIKSCNKVKALGARHSFNGIADTAGDQISLQNFDQMAIDVQARTVTVGAGVKYGQLAPYLDSHGCALHNLASLPHVTVAGACATATHGSGNKNGNLSTAVAGIEFVTGTGEIVALSRERDGERFLGAVVGLGGVGLVTKITLTVLPTFKMRQVVYENLSFDQLDKHLDEIFSSGYSVSLFTDWQNHRITQVWIKSRVEPGGSSEIKTEFFGAKPATRNLHPLTGHSAENCTEQMDIPGPWYERLPHFRMNFTPSSGAELQSEYFVPREKGYQAILAIEKLRNHVTPHLFISELRTIAADDLWMSPCYKRDTMTIHFTWKPEWPAVKNVLPMIEKQLAPFDARPHWAKLFTIAPSRLQSYYEKLPDFRELLSHYDPNGRFRNVYLNTNIYAS
ncbi:MAG: FAD-binding protein [Acidobacteriaceae bacterium]|nr:FAD-binding protein [Acidobacteriaceae bacterium]